MYWRMLLSNKSTSSKIRQSKKRSSVREDPRNLSLQAYTLHLRLCEIQDAIASLSVSLEQAQKRLYGKTFLQSLIKNMRSERRSTKPN